MLLFQPPPPTRYDLRFNLAGIPIRVHPLFWLMTVFFGASSSSFIQLLIWIAAVFVSILVHELGHALAMWRYGQPSQVILHLAGGLTVPEPVWWGNRYASVSLQPNQEILVSLAGPGAGFLLAALVMAVVVAAGGSITVIALFGVIPLPTALLPGGGGIVNLLVMTLLWVNVFWGAINLMPVYPLDGGNVARNLLVRVDPWNGVRKSLWISVISGTVVALAGLFLMRSIYIALLFGFLAFQSYQSIRGRPWGGL